MSKAVNIERCFERFEDLFSPKIVGELNGQYVKVAKMLGLGYPGGMVIDKLAAQGDAKRIVFTRPYLDKKEFDFSFSGLKTAVYRHIQKFPESIKAETAHIAAGFQAAVVDVLAHKLM